MHQLAFPLLPSVIHVNDATSAVRFTSCALLPWCSHFEPSEHSIRACTQFMHGSGAIGLKTVQSVHQRLIAKGLPYPRHQHVSDTHTRVPPRVVPASAMMPAVQAAVTPPRMRAAGVAEGRVSGSSPNAKRPACIVLIQTPDGPVFDLA